MRIYMAKILSKKLSTHKKIPRRRSEALKEGLGRARKGYKERESDDACASILVRFYRNEMRKFIRSFNPEIKFWFYDDKTEYENNCACVIRLPLHITRSEVPVPNPR